MTSTQIWLAIIGMTFVTAVTRAMFLIGGERTVLPERVQRMLRYAPAAALAAVVLPDVLATPEGSRSRRRTMSFTRRCPVSCGFCGGAPCSVRLSWEWLYSRSCASLCN